VSDTYIVCAACGARIRADRDRCLRCGEMLQAAETPAAPPSLAEWLRSSNPRHLVVGAVASLGILVGAVLWTESPSTTTSVAHPVATSTKPAASPVAVPGQPLAPGDLIAPATTADSVRLASAAFTSGDFETAKIRYQQALEKKADDPEALNGLGLVLERQGQLDDAVKQLERAAAAAPETWKYRFNLAHALGERGNWDRAIDEYRAASGIFPDDYATRYNLALAIHKKGDDEAAIPEFRKAITLAPREPSFHLSLGISLEKTGKIDEAQREYQQYLEMAPWAADADKLKDHLKALSSGAPGSGKTPSTP